jgi:hypothetical protein
VDADALPPMAADVRTPDEARRVVISSAEVMPALHALSGWMMQGGYEVADLQVRRPTLEDVYLGLTEAPR